MLKALVFDMDGTLCDSDPYHIAAFCKALEPYGRTVDEDFYRANISGRTNPEIGALLLPDRSASEHSRFADEKEALFRNMSRRMEPAPGLLALIERAARMGLLLAVVTNAPRANLIHTLRALDLEHAFEVEIAGEDVARGKPDPLPYLTALERLGVAAREAIAFEDSLPGVRSAVGAGLVTIGLTTTRTAADLIEAGAVEAIADFEDPRVAHRLGF